MTTETTRDEFSAMAFYGNGRGPYLALPDRGSPPALPAVELVREALGEGLSAEQLVPLAEVHAAHERALEAARALESGRPGGESWAEAERADAAAAASGKPPKVWQLAELLRADPDRWATACALRSAWRAKASAFAGREGDGLRRVVLTAASAAAREIEREIGQHARAGWEARADRATAWAERSAADALARSLAALVALKRWAGGGEWTWTPGRSAMPGGAAGGHMHVLAMYLDGNGWIGPLAGLRYPADVESALKKGAPLLPVAGR